MGLLTVTRAATGVGMLVVGWSMTLTWGDIGRGPPPQWERQVVGAALLLFVALVALAAVGPIGSRRSWIARGVAVAASVGAAGLAMLLRADAGSNRYEHLLGGAGWTWMIGGAGMAMVAALWTLVLKPAAPPKQPVAAKRSPAKKKKNRARK